LWSLTPIISPIHTYPFFDLHALPSAFVKPASLSCIVHRSTFRADQACFPMFGRHSTTVSTRFVLAFILVLLPSFLYDSTDISMYNLSPLLPILNNLI